MASTFFSRFESLCREASTTPNGIAKELGIASGSITNWGSGKMPKVDALLKISRRFGVSVEWLLGEKDDPRPVAGALSELDKKYRALDGHGKKLVDAVIDIEYERCTGRREHQAEIIPIRTIRHYLVPAAAGYASPIEGEEYEEIPLPEGAPHGADFCITVRGDSMEPYIKDGQLVYVQRGASLREFDAGVFFVDGDVFCKQWCVDYAGTLHLLSANPKRQDANVEIRKDSGRHCVCFGKVLIDRKLPPPVYV